MILLSFFTICIETDHTAISNQNNDWKFEKEVYPGITCYSKPEPGLSLRKFLATGLVPIEPKKLATLLWESKNRLAWDISYDSIDTIISNYTNQESNDHIMLVRLKIKPVLIVSARDFCMIQLKRNFQNNGNIGSVSFSIEDERVPVDTNFVRGEVLPGSAWFIEPVPIESSSSTSSQVIHSRLTYIILTDIKGWVPAFAINNAVAQTFTNYYTELYRWAENNKST